MSLYQCIIQIPSERRELHMQSRLFKEEEEKKRIESITNQEREKKTNEMR